MEVNSLDSIGTVLVNPNFLVYLEDEEPVMYGTNKVTRDMATNDLIHHLIMRQKNISMAEAIRLAYKTKPSLVITDTKTFIDSVYEYRIFH